MVRNVAVITSRNRWIPIAKALASDDGFRVRVYTPAKLDKAMTDGAEVILWDMKTPALKPFWTLCEKARERGPFCVLFNVPRESEIEYLALLKGAHGVFFREDSAALFARALSAIDRGELWFSRRSLNRFAEEQRQTGEPHGRSSSMRDILTSSELKALLSPTKEFYSIAKEH